MMTPRQRTIALARAERRCKAPDDQSAGPPLAPERACPMCACAGTACGHHRAMQQESWMFANQAVTAEQAGAPADYTTAEPDKRRKGARPARRGPYLKPYVQPRRPA